MGEKLFRGLVALQYFKAYGPNRLDKIVNFIISLQDISVYKNLFTKLL